MSQDLTLSKIPELIMPEFKSIQAGEGNIFIIGDGNCVQQNLEAVKKLAAIKGVMDLDVAQDTKMAAIADLVEEK